MVFFSLLTRSFLVPHTPFLVQPDALHGLEKLEPLEPTYPFKKTGGQGGGGNGKSKKGNGQAQQDSGKKAPKKKSDNKKIIQRTMSKNSHRSQKNQTRTVWGDSLREYGLMIGMEG